MRFSLPILYHPLNLTCVYEILFFFLKAPLPRSSENMHFFPQNCSPCHKHTHFAVQLRAGCWPRVSLEAEIREKSLLLCFSWWEHTWPRRTMLPPNFPGHLRKESLKNPTWSKSEFYSVAMFRSSSESIYLHTFT